MTRKFRIERRAISLALVLVLATAFELTGPSSTDAIGPLLPFAAALIQALPAIETVVKKVIPGTPNPKQTQAVNDLNTAASKGKLDLALYAQRQQIVWRITKVSNHAAGGIAAMIQIAGAKTALTAAEVSQLNRQLSAVDATIKSIVDSKPEPEKVFTTDAELFTALQDLLDRGPRLVSTIKDELKYNPKDPNPQLVSDLHQDLAVIDAIFQLLNRVTATEISMIASGLASVSATTPPAPTDKKGIKKASDDATAQVFGNVAALDLQIQKSDALLEKSVAYQKLLAPKDKI
jgi:hypothetical protein